jgi:hypothetical protein
VLVVEEVGKQLAIRRIVIMRAGAFERRRSRSHDLARKKPIAIADATIGGDKANRCVRFEGLPSTVVMESRTTRGSSKRGR